VIPCLPGYHVMPQDQGQMVTVSWAPAGGQHGRAYGPSGGFIGLVEGQPDGALQPHRLFVRAAGLGADKAV